MMTQNNLFWGNHLNYFCIKFRSIDAQVLSRSFHTKIIQSTTAITSIAIRALHESKKKSNKKSLQSFCYFLLLQKVESLLTSSLRGRIVDSHEAIHITKIKEHK